MISTVIAKFVLFTTVRLVDGEAYNEGRMEVYYNGEWGTVCDSNWDSFKAKLVCMQLGFGSLGVPSDFGPGIGRVLLDNIICFRNDTMIASCGHYGVGITPNCGHSKDVGVKCLGITIILFLSC